MKTNAMNTSEKIKYNVFEHFRLENTWRNGKPPYTNRKSSHTMVGRPRRTHGGSLTIIIITKDSMQRIIQCIILLLLLKTDPN